MANNIVQVFITALTVDGDQVVLWGQADPSSAAVIENNLARHIKDNPHVVPNDTSNIRQGLKCSAYHSDGKYYRVRVKSVLPGFVQVQTLDYGFTFYVDPHNLRVPRYEDDPFNAMPDEAVPFYAYEISTSHELSKGEIDILEKGIVFTNVTVKLVASVMERNVALFFKGNYNVQETWLQSGLLRHMPFQIQKNKIINIIQSALNQQFAQSRAAAFPDTSLPPPPPHIPPSRPKSNLLDNNELLDALAERVKGRIVPKEAPYYPPPVPLSQGTTYSVIVTEGREGPWSFSIQLKNDERLIAKVADDMQKADKVVLRPPVFPGKPCLGFYTTRNLYARGVIVKVGHQTVSVTFVDYGGTEDLSLRELLEMPSYGFQVQTLSQQFSLAQLDQLKVPPDEIPEVKQFFSEIVANKPLLLKVTAPEENCMQNCELYDGATNANVKNDMNLKLKQMKKAFIAPTLPQSGASFRAYISHVESLTEFYVQNREREREITELLDELQIIVAEGREIAEKDINVGLSCLSLFSDGLWYRARVTSVQKGTASVFFVDYGNADTVKASSLKEIPRKLVTKYKTLAIRCCLDNSNNLDQTSKLEDLINDENISVNVLEVESSEIVVKILHNGHNIMDPPPLIALKENSNLRLAIASPEPANNWEPSNNASSYQRQVVGPLWREEQKGREAGKNSRRRSTDHDRNKKWRSNEKTNWRDSEKSPNNDSGFKKRFDNNNGGGFKKRFDNNEEGGGFKKRFDNDNGGGYKKRFDNNDDGGGYKKRFDNNDDGGGYKKRFDNNDDGGGFKKRFDDNDNGGGFKKRFDNNDNGGGFKKRFDNNDNAGFKKRFDNEDGERSRPPRVPIKNDDRAMPGSKYEDQFINPDSVQDVTVTYFLSPVDFFVQNYTDKNAFTEMMEKIQNDYVNKFSVRQGTVLQEGEIAVAKFSEDRVLYRAEVITPEPITVRFVDYGNVDSIRDTRDIYPVMKNLVDLPKQSVRCSLHGVQPKGDAWSGDVSSYFEKSSLSCKFISEECGIYSVTLTAEDGDVATALINAGLAEPVGSPKLNSTPVVKESVSSIDIDPYDITLLPGQILSVEVPYIDGVGQFFCHYNPIAVQTMEKTIAAHFSDPKMQHVLNPDDILPGQLCIGNSDNVFYRAKVVERSDEGVWVHFIDYGDTKEIAQSEVFKIPEHLSSIPPLSFECYLFGDISEVSDEDQDKFKAEFEMKKVIISIHELVNESVSVTVYDINGIKSKIPEGINESPEIVSIPDMPLTAHQLSVNVQKFMDNSSVIISLAETSPPDISSCIFSNDEAEKVSIGSACAVKCENELWCRGVRESETEAYLVDFGETKTVSHFCPLPNDFYGIPAYVRKVAITWPILGANSVKIIKQDNIYSIEPTEKLVFITHVESANELYVRSSCLDIKLNEIQESLCDTQPGELPSSKIFSARFPDDELWYRATLETSEPLSVHFIDYGNKSEVSEVGEVPSLLVNIPPLAVRVTFDEEFPKNAKEVLENESFSEIPIKIVEKNGKVIDLISNGTSIVSKMLGRLAITVGDVIYISFIISPAQFYVQRSKDTKVLEDIADKLVAAENYPEVEKDVTKLVAAKYSDDDAWYRARIENDQVFFVDHGNYAELGEIRELPEDLQKIEPLAQEVSLINATGGEWSDSAIEAFMEFIDGRSLTVHQVVPCGNSYKMELHDDGINIINSLGSQVETLAEAENSSEVLPEAHVPDDFSDPTTDDHKFVALTDDQRAERNETDEQKRGKMEGPRSDDEKREPCASGTNLPDELDVTSLVHEIIDCSVARAHVNLQTPVEAFSGPEGVEETDPESPFYSPLPMDNINMTDDIATNNSDSNITDDVATNTSVQNITDDVATNNSDQNISDDVTTHSSDQNISDDVATNNSDQNIADDVATNSSEQNNADDVATTNSDHNITDDIAFNSDNDSGMSSHPIADTSHSPEAGDVDFEDAVGSPGSADTVPTTEEETIEFIPLEDTTVVSSEDLCELEETVIIKDTSKTDGSRENSRRSSLCDKIVPGSINRGIDLSHDSSST